MANRRTPSAAAGSRKQEAIPDRARRFGQPRSDLFLCRTALGASDNLGRIFFFVGSQGLVELYACGVASAGARRLAVARAFT
jgi:hypothetical protein